MTKRTLFSSLDEKAGLLRAIPGLADSNPDVLVRLMPLVDEVSFAAEATLVREGSYGSQVFVVVDGHADVIAGGERLATVERGDYVGEVAVLDHGVRTASVVATTPVRALAMDPRSFATLLREPLVATKLAAQLARRVRTMDTVTTG
jgi:CRP-like cAMP-binding protein